MADIEKKADIELLVNTFYTEVLKNELLKPFFKHLNFEHHMPRMIHFWSFILLDEEGYKTNMTETHSKMPLTAELFDTWVKLFSETVDKLFQGEKANLAKERAMLLGWTMKSKL
jgi:hemoglobin